MKNVPVIAASIVLGLLLGALIVGSGGTIIAAGATEAIKQIIAFFGFYNISCWWKIEADFLPTLFSFIPNQKETHIW